MELIYFLWALLSIGCVISIPDMFHESLDDGKKLLTSHHHHLDNHIQIQYNQTKRTTNATNHMTRYGTINTRHDISRYSHNNNNKHLTGKSRNKLDKEKRSLIKNRNASNNIVTEHVSFIRNHLPISSTRNRKRSGNSLRKYGSKSVNNEYKQRRSKILGHVKVKERKTNSDKRSQILNYGKSIKSKHVQAGSNTVRRSQISSNSRKLNNNKKNNNTFNKDDNHKKAEVFLLDSSKLGDDGSISPALGGRGGDSASAVGSILSPEDFEDSGTTATGDKKDGVISSTGDDSLAMADIDGKNPDTLEENVVMKSDAVKGNILPMVGVPSSSTSDDDTTSFKTLDAAALQSNIPAEVDYLKGVANDAETGGDKKDITSSSSSFGSYNKDVDLGSIDISKLIEQDAGATLDNLGGNVHQGVTKDTTGSITKQLENGEPSKAVDSLLEPIESSSLSSSGTSKFLNMATAEIKTDPGVSRAVSDDTVLDDSTRNAIKEEMNKDVALATRMSTGKVDVSSTAKDTTRSSAFNYKKGAKSDVKKGTGLIIGDIASIAEAVDKVALHRAGVKSRGVKKQNMKKKHKKLDGKVQKMMESSSDDSLSGVNLDDSHLLEGASLEKTKTDDKHQEQRLTSNVDIMNAHASTLTENEQNLISSIDRAARRKDVATEMAARIVMPMTVKNNAFSEQALAPPEQLLDMLSHGKFNDPLPESVLDRLSNLDPNKPMFPSLAATQQRQQHESAVSRSNSPGRLMQVGSELLPVRSIALNYQKAVAAKQQQQQASARQLAKVEQLMKSNPEYLAQNNMLLDANNFKSVQDLSNIGESVFSQNVIDLKKPLLLGGSNNADSNAVTKSISGGESISGTLGEASSEDPQFLSSQVMSIATPNGAIKTVNNPLESSASLLNSVNKVTVTGNVRGSLAMVPTTGDRQETIMQQHGSSAVGSLQDGGNLGSEVTVPQEIMTQHNNLNAGIGQHGSLAAALPAITNGQRILHQETHIVKNDIDPMVMDKINNLPSLNMEKVLKAHRHKHKKPPTFEGAMSETSVDRNTADEFVPERMITLPEEHVPRKPYSEISLSKLF